MYNVQRQHVLTPIINGVQDREGDPPRQAWQFLMIVVPRQQLPENAL